ETIGFKWTRRRCKERRPRRRGIRTGWSGRSPLHLVPQPARRAGHPPRDGADVGAVAAGGAAGVPGPGGGEAGGELGGFLIAETRGGFVEVVPRGRFGAVDAGAEFHHVQIDVKDAPLGQVLLELAGEEGLFHLA